MDSKCRNDDPCKSGGGNNNGPDTGRGNREDRGPEVCGDGRVGAGEECDLGGGNGGCPSDCSGSCRRNSCGGACELPSSPYFSQSDNDLVKYGRRLENGSCYRIASPVDGRCHEATGPTRIGVWSGRDGSNCSPSDSNCVDVCNSDNACPGCYLGKYSDSSRETCERRYSCSVDNGVPITVDMLCGGSNGPCEINMGQSSNLSWTVTTRYGCGSDGNCWNNSDLRSKYVTTCTAAGDWSGTKAQLEGGDQATESKIATATGSQSTGILNTNRTYTYTLNCSNSFASAQDTVNVIVRGSIPNNPSNVSATQPNYCSSGPATTISWNYSDPIGSPQTAYQVQVDDNAGFSSPDVDSGKVNSSSTAYATAQGYLQFSRTYRARVRVWNSYDQASGWTESSTWPTPPYAYPQVEFTWSPTKPGQGQLTQFTDQTVFGGGSSNGRTWFWAFGDGAASSIQNPSHIYTVTGNYLPTLIATDAAGQSCAKQHSLTVQKPLPLIKEVAPK